MKNIERDAVCQV